MLIAAFIVAILISISLGGLSVWVTILSAAFKVMVFVTVSLILFTVGNFFYRKKHYKRIE